MHIIRGLLKMSAQTLTDRAHDWGVELEDRLTDRLKGHYDDARHVARKRLAGALGQAPGTLYNLRNRRLKSVGADLYLGLRRALVNELREEVTRLENRIALLEATGGAAAELDLDALKAKLDEVRQAVGGEA
jgi:polyhydroxyalkanoate synthesis regulator phasin